VYSILPRMQSGNCAGARWAGRIQE